MDSAPCDDLSFGAPPWRLRLAAWLVALTVVASGIATLPGYGVTCDEAYGNLFFGERYFNYFRTLDPTYLNFRNADLTIHRRVPNLFRATWRFNPWAFPPLADTLSAAGMELLGHRLRWLDPIDAFHVAPILLVGALLIVLFEFAAPRIGVWAALLGIAILGSYPRFWGDMHDNVKDVPEAVFFAFAVIGLVRWSARPSPARAIGAGVLAGAALAVKVNAVFLPFIVVLGLWPWRSSWQGFRPVVAHVSKLWAHYLLMIFAAGLTFYLSWPWLHRNGLVRFGRHVAAFVSQGDREGHPGWNPDPLLQTVITMPELVLALVLVGTAALLHRIVRGRDHAGVGRLLLAWMLVPILRNSVPGAVNFDGIRHFLEFLPAAALVAAMGAASLVASLSPRRRVLAGAALVLALTANVGEALWRYQPFQPLYFNHLVGGLRGANERFGIPEATDYWGSSYRQGVRWLNENAEPNARVYVSVFPHIMGVIDRLWLRPDIRWIESAQLQPSIAAGRTVYVMFVTRIEFYDEIARQCTRRQRPVHELRIAGLPVLVIYRAGHSSIGGGS